MIQKTNIFIALMLVFFSCQNIIKQRHLSSETLKNFFFQNGASDYVKPVVKERYFGNVKSVRSVFYIFSEKDDLTFEKSYFNEQGIKYRIEGGRVGEIDTVLWFRTIEYTNGRKKESYYLDNVLKWSRRWDYYSDKDLIVEITDSANYNVDTVRFYRLIPLESIVEESEDRNANIYTDFLHYNENGEIDYFGYYDFRVDKNDSILDKNPRGRTIELKRKFDKNGCYCQQVGLTKSFDIKYKFENDKFCNRIKVRDSENFYSYTYDEKNNWVKRYGISYKNKSKPDTLTLEIREINYYPSTK